MEKYNVACDCNVAGSRKETNGITEKIDWSEKTAVDNSLMDYISTRQRGKRYQTYGSIPQHLRQRLMQAEANEQLKTWADTVNAVPRYTDYLPELTSKYIKNARRVWAANVSGNSDILQVILRHAVEYGKTGRTSPILLSGPPGIGKTLIAKTYSEILGLPCSFIFGPSAAVDRGLAGAPNMFVGAGAGAIVQAMITTGKGNPVICIDEIDKATGGHTGLPAFQNTLLSALDESCDHWHDNYVELEIDISHIPFIFTANDTSLISTPLLDRMEVIEMQAPTREMLHEITKNHMLPKVLKKYGHSKLRINDNVIPTLVDQLWRNGNRSCRPYKKAIERLISDGFLEMLENEQAVTITEQDARTVANNFVHDSACSKPIGFLSA